MLYALLSLLLREVDIADVDDELGELFIEEIEPTVEQLQAAIRRATIAQDFTPVFLGSAFKNRGVQPMLDGVISYLPAPHEVENKALDLDDDEKTFLQKYQQLPLRHINTL